MHRVWALVLAASAVATSCGGDSSAGCVEVREPLDPYSIQHVIDADTVTFLTNPPTSGPHLSGPIPTGLVHSPLSGASQVQVLEVGGIVVQYEEPVSQDDLLPLLDSHDYVDDNTIPLTVAPGIDLPAPVVATAWTWKLTCGSPDLDAIAAFAAARSAGAPESPAAVAG